MDLDNDLKLLMFGFITLLIGIVLASTISDEVASTSDDEFNTSYETIAISSARQTITENIAINSSGTGMTARPAVTSLVVFGNSTLNTSSVGAVNFTYPGLITAAANFSGGNYNITYIVATNSAGTTSYDDVISLSYFGNKTLNTSHAGIAINSQVNYTSTGAVSVTAANFTDGNYEVSYSHYGSNYIADSTVRVILGLIPLFFIIGGVLMVAISFAIKMEIGRAHV